MTKTLCFAYLTNVRIYRVTTTSLPIDRLNRTALAVMNRKLFLLLPIEDIQSTAPPVNTIKELLQWLYKDVATSVDMLWKLSICRLRNLLRCFKTVLTNSAMLIGVHWTLRLVLSARSTLEMSTRT
jgi:hypothetical protein